MSQILNSDDKKDLEKFYKIRQMITDTKVKSGEWKEDPYKNESKPSKKMEALIKNVSKRKSEQAGPLKAGTNKLYGKKLDTTAPMELPVFNSIKRKEDPSLLRFNKRKLTA
jgi:hypothetical protein